MATLALAAIATTYFLVAFLLHASTDLLDWEYRRMTKEVDALQDAIRTLFSRQRSIQDHLLHILANPHENPDWNRIGESLRDIERHLSKGEEDWQIRLKVLRSVTVHTKLVVYIRVFAFEFVGPLVLGFFALGFAGRALFMA